MATIFISYSDVYYRPDSFVESNVPQEQVRERIKKLRAIRAQPEYEFEDKNVVNFYSIKEDMTRDEFRERQKLRNHDYEYDEPDIEVICEYEDEIVSEEDDDDYDPILEDFRSYDREYLQRL